MRILVAEDNPDNRDMLARRLQRHGFDVDVVENGLEAIRYARQFAPDIILMDLSMPVMSGLEAVRELRTDKEMQAIKVIALTAHALPEVRLECVEAGFDAFATKPVDFTALLATIQVVGDRLRRDEAAAIEAGADPSPPPGNDALLPDESRSDRRRILVVDDQPVNHDMLRRRLERNGYEVVVLENALTIESVILVEKIDLVLLDWMMPQRSGIDALAGLRQKYDMERLPVIMVTALETSDVVTQALQAGANDYVAKPIDFQVLQARIKVQLDRREAVLAFDKLHEQLEEAVRDRTSDLVEANRQLKSQIASREAAEAREMAMALHDTLTGLPNRSNFRAWLVARLAEIDPERMVAVVAIDLRRFKSVNNLHGRDFGDQLLIAIADRLSNAVKQDGLAARLASDEFALALTYATDEELLGRVAALSACLEAPFNMKGMDIFVSAILGVTISGSQPDEAEVLLRSAETALQRAKQDVGSRFAFFEPGMEARIQDRALLERDLRIAIQDGQIEPNYQPIVDLQTGDILGYEILARWRHPTRGMIMPDQFIPIAEDTGQIGDLSMGLLRRACMEAHSLPGVPRLSLNISTVQLPDTLLAQKVLKIVTECAFPIARLGIEVTEDGLVSDFEKARQILQSFKNLGVEIALDDFGTGYSSLCHLRELPCDVLKIDKSFVHDVSDSDEARNIIKTIVDLGRNFSLKVTAEGVETAEQATELAALGCDTGQGYLFGRPLPVLEIAQSAEMRRSISGR